MIVWISAGHVHLLDDSLQIMRDWVYAPDLIYISDLTHVSS